MKESTFQPPRDLSYEEGIERIKTAVSETGVDVSRDIFTSKHPAASKLQKLLEFPGMSAGFKKHQLPFALDGAQMFISSAPPNARVAEHSHAEGDGVRFIASGSIKFNGEELGPGDWMYIPAGKPYGFETGPNGAGMFYCYQCCC